MRTSSFLRRMGAWLLALLLLFSACDTADPGQTDDTTSETENPTPIGTTAAREWVEYMLNTQTDFISCTVGGEAFSNRATQREVTNAETEVGTVYTVTETDTASGLKFVTVLTLYALNDAVELVTTIENTAASKSPIISELLAADVALPIPGRSGITLTTARGCLATGVDDDYDFGELRYEMGVGGSYTFAPAGGRSCHEAWPYFNLIGSEGGAIAAIGWTGQWEATFTTVPGGARLCAGQQYFNAYLKPGESVKTPSITVLFYQGASEDGHNDFRRMYLNYYTPENVKDEDFIFPVSFSISYTKQEVLNTLQACKNAGLKDLCAWMDAGWYGESKTDWSGQVGNWYPNSDLGKSGMKAVSDAIHEAGYRFILWMEPERAQKTSEAAKNRSLFYEHEGVNGLLLRLDTEEGYEWMFNLVSSAVTDYGMDIYRQDFNINPLEYWLENDDDDRVGISENHYINNLYRLMDALLEAHPHLVIDNCASGGRRLDIAMMKRCVSLFRTDYSCLDTCDPQGYQYHTQSILPWIPLSSAGLWADLNDPYVALSTLSVGQIVGSGNGTAISLTLENQAHFRGNYYSLLTPTYDETSHQAWELFDPDSGTGIAVLLARPKTKAGELNVKLKGLDPEKHYTVKFAGAVSVLAEGSGEELMTNGVSVQLYPRSGKLLSITQTDAVEAEG